MSDVILYSLPILTSTFRQFYHKKQQIMKGKHFLIDRHCQAIDCLRESQFFRHIGFELKKYDEKYPRTNLPWGFIYNNNFYIKITTQFCYELANKSHFQTYQKFFKHNGTYIVSSTSLRRDFRHIYDEK